LPVALPESVPHPPFHRDLAIPFRGACRDCYCTLALVAENSLPVEIMTEREKT
jgi:hypothetical protein